MSDKCKELFPHEDPVNLNKFFGDPRGSNGLVSKKWYAENIVKWTPPYPMFYSDGKKTPFKTMLLHKKVTDVCWDEQDTNVHKILNYHKIVTLFYLKVRMEHNLKNTAIKSHITIQ